MANQIAEQRLVDTNNRLLTKLTGIYDGTGQSSNAVVLDASTLTFALNTNGYVMTGNTDPRTYYRVYPTCVRGVSSVPFLKLTWAGTGLFGNNTDMLVIPQGAFNFDMADSFKGGILKSGVPTANGNGDLLLSTLGAAANQGFSIIIDCRKEPVDYDFGRAADPMGLRRGFDVGTVDVAR